MLFHSTYLLHKTRGRNSNKTRCQKVLESAIMSFSPSARSSKRAERPFSSICHSVCLWVNECLNPATISMHSTVHLGRFLLPCSPLRWARPVSSLRRASSKKEVFTKTFTRDVGKHSIERWSYRGIRTTRYDRNEATALTRKLGKRELFKDRKNSQSIF